MPNGRDTDPVAFGRWEEAHRALADRVTDCEHDIEGIWDNIRTSNQRRVNRQWQIALAMLTAFLLPLVLYVVSLTFGSIGH